MKTANLLKLPLYVACSLMLMIPSKGLAAETKGIMAPTKNQATRCEPTPADYEGPFYRPAAPLRASVGKGYQLQGTVMSSEDCNPVAQARIELWMAGPDGRYDDDYRATIFSAALGEYRFESNFPPAYSGRPPHIHIRVAADGFRTLTTQHYPAINQETGIFDLVLVPVD